MVLELSLGGAAVWAGSQWETGGVTEMVTEGQERCRRNSGRNRACTKGAMPLNQKCRQWSRYGARVEGTGGQ